MPDHSPFAELMQRLHAGDKAAREEFADRFGKALRLYIRTRISPQMQRHFDSTEIWDSVWARLQLRMRSGKWRPEWDVNEDKLLGLLFQMARDNVAEKARNPRNQVGSLPSEHDQADDEPGPDEIALLRDLRERARQLCSADEWALLDARCQGLSPDELAARFGKTVDAIRMQLARLVKYLRDSLGGDSRSPERT